MSTIQVSVMVWVLAGFAGLVLDGAAGLGIVVALFFCVGLVGMLINRYSQFRKF